MSSTAKEDAFFKQETRYTRKTSVVEHLYLIHVGLSPLQYPPARGHEAINFVSRAA